MAILDYATACLPARNIRIPLNRLSTLSIADLSSRWISGVKRVSWGYQQEYRPLRQDEQRSDIASCKLNPTKCIFATRSVPQRDSNLLWGRSAGRCAFPACPNICIDTFEQTGTILLGEMAHVIAYSKRGPRAAAAREEINSYDNLVIVCPYHHAIIDKAPYDFPRRPCDNGRQI